MKAALILLLAASAQEGTLDLLDGETLYDDGWLLTTGILVDRQEGLLDGSRRRSDPFERNREDREVWLSGHYGLRHDLQLSAMVPVVSRTLTLDDPAGPDRFSASGLGDLALAAKWRFYRWDAPHKTLNVAAIAGLELPTGEDDAMDHGILLPIELQPGSGSWDAFLGGAATYEPGRWRFNAMALFRRNGHGDMVKQGDVSFAELAIGNRFWLEPYPGPFMRLDIMVRWRHQSADRRHGSIVADTGGDLLSAGANWAFRPRPSLDFQLGIEAPIDESVRGVQLRQRATVMFTFGYRF